MSPPRLQPPPKIVHSKTPRPLLSAKKEAVLVIHIFKKGVDKIILVNFETLNILHCTNGNFHNIRRDF